MKKPKLEAKYKPKRKILSSNAPTYISKYYTQENKHQNASLSEMNLRKNSKLKKIRSSSITCNHILAYHKPKDMQKSIKILKKHRTTNETTSLNAAMQHPEKKKPKRSPSPKQKLQNHHRKQNHQKNQNNQVNPKKNQKNPKRKNKKNHPKKKKRRNNP